MTRAACHVKNCKGNPRRCKWAAGGRRADLTHDGMVAHIWRLLDEGATTFQILPPNRFHGVPYFTVLHRRPCVT